MALLLNAGDTVSRSYSYTQPSPLHPSLPQGTGELETNLAIISGDSQTVENGYYKNVRISDVLEAGTYTVTYVIDERTGNASSSSVGFGTLNIYKKDMTNITVANVPITITATVTLEVEGCLWARFLRAGSPTNFSYSVSHVRIEKGTHSYSIKIPISSASTTTPVYLGEVETTRKIKKLVLTGEEGWKKSTTYQGSFYSPQVLINCALQGLICTHAEYTPVINATEYIYGKCAEEGGAVNKTLDLYLGDSSWTAADFKAFLAAQYANGTPVTVWYVLAEPETGIVNEPLRKIGDYADTVSGITIPTISGGDTLSIDTTLQPSEVTVNYKGWHPVANVHERESGAWTE